MNRKLSDLVVDCSALENDWAGCGYTLAEVLSILRSNCSIFNETLGDGRVREIVLKDISDGKGYLSNVYKTRIHFEDPNRSLSLIMKIPTTKIIAEENMKGMNEEGKEQMKRTHSTECRLYNLFRQIDDGVTPKNFFAEEASAQRPGLIVMEDLSESCITYGLYRSATAEQFWNVAKKIAHFQSLISTLDPKQWRGKFPHDFHTKDFHSSFTDLVTVGLVGYDIAFAPLVDSLMKVVGPKFSKFALIDKPSEYNAITVCHGDMWTNNILFERSADGSVSDQPRGFIDWQLCFEGNPLVDICRYLWTALDAEIRREVQPHVGRRFHEMLVEEYRKSGAGKVPIDRNQCEELFELALIDQSLVIAFLVPFFQNDRTAADPEVTKAKLDKLALRTRLALEDTLKLIAKRGLQNFALT